MIEKAIAGTIWKMLINFDMSLNFIHYFTFFCILCFSISQLSIKTSFLRNAFVIR